MKRIIVLLTLAASMAVMFALAGSASAAKPEFETFQVEETEFIANCGTFEVRTDPHQVHLGEDTDKLCKALA